MWEATLTLTNKHAIYSLFKFLKNVVIFFPDRVECGKKQLTHDRFLLIFFSILPSNQKPISFFVKSEKFALKVSELAARQSSDAVSSSKDRKTYEAVSSVSRLETVGTSRGNSQKTW